MNFTLDILQDEDAFNPRQDWDHPSTMACFHTRYDIGDKDHGYSTDDYGSWEEMRTQMVKDGARVILPVYMLDHSGITIRTTSFNDPWDSGQIGFIFMTAAQIRENFMVKRITKDIENRTVELLKGEIAEYDSYLPGWGYVIKDENDATIESCWGFYGHEYAVGEGKIPCCVVCYGITPGADVVNDSPPSFEGRMAKCSSCSKEVPSSSSLAFFSYRPEMATDSYYSGCRGWGLRI